MEKKILFFALIFVMAVVVSGCGAKKPAVIDPTSNNASDAPRVPINSFSVSQDPVPAKTPTPVKSPEIIPAPIVPPASSSPASSEVISPASQKAQISIKDFSFNPAEVNVAVGSTVVWTNNDAISHDIKFASFNSPLLDAGNTFEKKFTTAGTYDYSCDIHPSMAGKIIVK